MDNVIAGVGESDSSGSLAAHGQVGGVTSAKLVMTTLGFFPVGHGA